MIKKIKNFVSTTIIGGLLVLLPITLFVLFVRLLFNFIRRLVDPVSNLLGFSRITNELLLDSISITAIILFCFFVGLVTKTRFGRGFFNQIDRFLAAQLPFYGGIRDTIQQFMGAKEMPFSKVVLVDVFNTGTRMLGFISEEHPNGNFTVFVPTAPNPTNGFIFHVKKSQLEFLEVKPEDAMRVVIGVGTGMKQLL